MKTLVIVESPTKAKTISKYLGSDYSIKASMGHVMDLPKSTLAVDIDHNFKPEFELVPDKKKIVDELKKIAKNATSIILATDPDREGEAIASHVKDVLVASLKLTGGKAGQSSKFSRIVFHEITKEAIEDAIKNPRKIDENLVDAQTARRVLDRLVGYKLSPLLWQKVRRGLSAGRVQSVALRLIVEREREIEKFKKEEYFTINVILNCAATQIASTLGVIQDLNNKEEKMPKQVRHDKSKGIEFELIEINEEKIEKQEKFNLYDGEYTVSKTVIDAEKKAQEIVDDLKTKKFIVADVLEKEVRKYPAPPFTTSSLQQEGARRFGFSGKRTMGVAQKLYEEGFITYHRTDSLNLASAAVSAMRSFVQKEYGDKYIPEQPRFYKTKQKSAQEAHEAIRLTKFINLQTAILDISTLGRDHVRLYELIWRRALASQMSEAITESTTVIVDSITNNVISSSSSSLSDLGVEDLSLRAEGLSEAKDLDSSSGSARTQNDIQKNYRLKANGSVLVFDGFLKLNPLALEDKKLPEFKVSEHLSSSDILAEKHETLPPPRYNDASLIKTLEEKEIGRPSTYATIVSTIESRSYIEREDKKFKPTSIGIAVNDFLVENFPDVDDIPFTAKMENQLDNVAEGSEKWVPMIKDFWDPFSKRLELAKGSVRVKIEVETTDQKCDLCGAPIVVRIGKFGKFLSCSRFPDCKFSKPFIEETGLVCPKDGGRIIVRKTKKGRKFYGCSNYPNCDFAAWKLEDIKDSSKIKDQKFPLRSAKQNFEGQAKTSSKVKK